MTKNLVEEKSHAGTPMLLRMDDYLGCGDYFLAGALGRGL